MNTYDEQSYDDSTLAAYKGIDTRYIVEVQNPDSFAAEVFVACCVAKSDLEACIEAMQFMKLNWDKFVGRNFKVRTLDKDLKVCYNSVVAWKDVMTASGYHFQAGDGV